MNLSKLQHLLWLPLLLVLAHPATSATNPVPKWDRFEIAIVNTNAYADPYRAVTLNVTYTKPDASTVNFWGFYDGGNIWRIRFMPDQIGTWSYAASFSDGSPGETNSFECVDGNLIVAGPERRAIHRQFDLAVGVFGDVMQHGDSTLTAALDADIE